MGSRLRPSLLRHLHRGAPSLVSRRWAVFSAMLWTPNILLDTQGLEDGVARGSQGTARREAGRTRKLGQDLLLGSGLFDVYQGRADFWEGCDLLCLQGCHMCHLQGGFSHWQVPDG
jgi:hypothetical protein